MVAEDQIKDEKGIEEREKKPSRGELIPGTILVILGILFLLPKLGIDFGNLWPTFILAPGLAFFVFYFSSGDRPKNAGILIPATITTLIAVFFFALNFTSWKYMENLWPLFPIIVAASFYFAYFMGLPKGRGILIPANILTAVGITFLLVNFLSVNLWPVLLIMAGLYFLLFPGKINKGEK